MKKENLVSILAASLILLFLYAGSGKLADLWQFRYDLSNQPFPAWLQKLLVWLVPLAEIVTAALLAWHLTRQLGFYAAALLMTLFTGYTLLILLHIFPFVPCSCGGVIRLLSWKAHLAFNCFFLTLALYGIKLTGKPTTNKAHLIR